MDEERRLNAANENLLKNVCQEVVKAAGTDTSPAEVIKKAIQDHGTVGIIFILLCIHNLLQFGISGL